MEQEGASPPPEGDGRSIFSSGGRAKARQSAHDGQLVSEELLRGVIHEVGTALTIIRLNAEVLERKISRKAASLSPLQVVEQQLDQEEDRVRQIVRQVQRVESLMTTIVDEVCLPKNAPRVPS
jgi:signal transduction histidine kinase